MAETQARFSPWAAASVVVANMVGTGVFTSLGYQLVDISSTFALLTLWVLGGVIALCGALCYAELGAALPRSGGEYNFVGAVYGRGLGFVSGWISATIGFAAPVALVAVTFGAYLQSVFPSLNESFAGVILIAAVTAAHVVNRRSSSRFQMLFTGIKVIVILMFCAAVWIAAPNPQTLSLWPSAGDGSLLTSSAFAVSLLYVNYAYTGWNAATYLSGELQDPQRYLSKVLVLGTLLVMGLYLLLNAAFLYSTPADAMRGNIEIGYIVAREVFGEWGGNAMGVLLAVLLVSTVSAMVIAGPRVLQMIGQDFAPLRFLARENRAGLPLVAILLQGTASIALVLTSTFESILLFAGFALSLNTVVTVLGLFVLRRRQPELPRPYTVALYPVPPLVFLGVSLWMLTLAFVREPIEGLFAAGLVVSGWLVYLASSRSASSR